MFKQLLVTLVFTVCSANIFAQSVKKPVTTATRSTVAAKKPAAKAKPAVIKKPAAKAKPSAKSITKAPVSKTVVEAPLKLSSREQQMIDEINLVRSDPAGYVQLVKDYLKSSKNNKQTTNAANELINELKKLSPLSKLSLNMNMYRDARDYGKTMMENNEMEHSDLPYNENLSFGIENIREVIIDLLIDADISNRGHRRNILSGRISMIAVHELPGTVEGYSFCYIQEFK